MLGALGLFCVATLQALERMGAAVDARDREVFVHLWAVVADMLGIAPALARSAPGAPCPRVTIAGTLDDDVVGR